MHVSVKVAVELVLFGAGAVLAVFKLTNYALACVSAGLFVEKV